jgi:hypothetical protein
MHGPDVTFLWTKTAEKGDYGLSFLPRYFRDSQLSHYSLVEEHGMMLRIHQLSFVETC